MLLWMACAIFCSRQLLDGGPHLLLQSGGELDLQRLAQLDRVGLHHGLQILLERIGKLLLQPGGIQQIAHGFVQQRLEGLGFHIGGKADLVQIQQTVADDIALVAVQDLFHQRLQAVLRDVQLYAVKQLAHVHLHVRQRQPAEIQLEAGGVDEGGKVERAISQVECAVQIKVQGAGIELESVL